MTDRHPDAFEARVLSLSRHGRARGRTTELYAHHSPGYLEDARRAMERK